MAPPRGPFPARLSDPEVESPSLAGAWTASSGRAAPHLARLGHQLDLRNPSRSISAIWFGGITRGERADLNPDLRSSAGWSSGSFREASEKHESFVGPVRRWRSPEGCTEGQPGRRWPVNMRPQR